MNYKERLKSSAPKLFSAVNEIVCRDGVYASEHKSIAYAFNKLELGDFSLSLAIDDLDGTVEDFFKEKESEYISRLSV